MSVVSSLTAQKLRMYLKQHKLQVSGGKATPEAPVQRYVRVDKQILEPEDNDAASDPDDSGDDSQSDSSEMGHFIEHSYVVLVVPDTDVECVTVQSKKRIQVYLLYL